MSFVNSYRYAASGGVPTTDLAFWYDFSFDADVTTAGGNITSVLDQTSNQWDAVNLGSSSLSTHNIANGYAQFINGQQGLQSTWMEEVGKPVGIANITSGFHMQVVEFNAVTAGRYLSGVCRALSPLGATSSNVYGTIQHLSSGGNKLSYRGRITSSSGTFLGVNGTTNVTTGVKYLVAIYVPQTGGTYLELDGNPEGTPAAGDRFWGILDPSSSGTGRYKVDMGGVQSTSWLSSSQSFKLYECISYQNFDQTAYDDVEAYLKTKYSIV